MELKSKYNPSHQKYFWLSRFLCAFLLFTGACEHRDAWKTYKNTTYHFAIDYPATWELDTVGSPLHETSMINFLSAEKDPIIKSGQGSTKSLSMVSVEALPNPDKLAARAWYNSPSNTMLMKYPAAMVESEEETTLNGIPAFKIVTNDAQHSFDYYVSVDDKLFRLTFERWANDQPGTLPIDVMNRMLNSFRVNVD